jgi:hypothetical protein
MRQAAAVGGSTRETVVAGAAQPGHRSPSCSRAPWPQRSVALLLRSRPSQTTGPLCTDAAPVGVRLSPGRVTDQPRRQGPVAVFVEHQRAAWNSVALGTSGHACGFAGHKHDKRLVGADHVAAVGAAGRLRFAHPWAHVDGQRRPSTSMVSSTTGSASAASTASSSPSSGDSWPTVMRNARAQARARLRDGG